jgi:acetyl esterase/lipase
MQEVEDVNCGPTHTHMSKMSERKEHLSRIQSLLADELDPSFFKRLLHLHDVCSQIETFYHEYDFRDVPCNGFRTFVKVTGFFLSGLVEACGQPLKNQDLINDYSAVSEMMVLNADAALIIRKKGHNYPLQCTDLDSQALAKFTQIEARHLEPLYGKIGPFYLLPEIQNKTLETLTAVHIMTAPILEKAYMLFSPKYRHKRQAAHAMSANLDYLHSMRKMDLFPVNLIMKAMIRPINCTAHYVSVPRHHNEWAIRIPDVKSPAVIERIREQEDKPPLDCLLVQPKSGPQNKSKSLIIHLPSGGMILQLANIYTTYMSKVSSELGVPVLVVKYAVAPEHPYPSSVQEILDLYTFLTSGDALVADMIGFQPENILFSGDSAGGHLATISLLALNEIRRKGGNVSLPKAMALQYPAMTIGFVASPSILMSGLDILTTIGELRLAIAAFAQTDPPFDLNYPLDNQPDGCSIDEAMRRFNDRLRDPLYEPLIYKHFNDFKKIPLSVVVCEMDCILDHGVDIAKKWPGPVTLDAAYGMPHGFPIGENTKSVIHGTEIIIKRIAALLDIDL